MAPALEGWVRRWWQGEAGLPGGVLSLLAAPAEGIFRSVVSVRNRSYERGWAAQHGAPVPVVSVGNLTVGGTGKTPMAAWVARALVGMGAAPTILSRGYGQDEVLLHRRWNPDIPVVVAPARIQGARQAARSGATVVVLDDGFQHRALARELDIVLLAAEGPLEGRLLPRGPFREAPGSLGRAHVAVVMRRTAEESEARRRAAEVVERYPHLIVPRALLRPDGWRGLRGGEATPPKGPVLALAGVARPEAFALLVERITGEPPELLTFPDHHSYGPEDADRVASAAAGRTLVTTEKDAVKLEDLSDRLPDVRVLALKVIFESGEEELKEELRRLVQPPHGGVSAGEAPLRGSEGGT